MSQGSESISPLDFGCYCAEPGEPCTTDSGRITLHAGRRQDYDAAVRKARAAELAEAGTDPDSLTGASISDGWPDKSKKTCSCRFADGQSQYLTVGQVQAIAAWWEAKGRHILAERLEAEQAAQSLQGG